MYIHVNGDSMILEELKKIALECGADDAGVISVYNDKISPDREQILKGFPYAKSLISFVIKVNPNPVRTPTRSIANMEFHEGAHDVDSIERKIARKLVERGYKASMAGAMGFPMETNEWPRKMWYISHKLVAEAAGMGVMGINRNVIHPKFGNFIFLGTVVTDIELQENSLSKALDYSPCFDCKLCVASCPVGAISPDGHFNFSSCYTHNYREFMGGFGTLVEDIIESKSKKEFRTKVEDNELVSWWQSLSGGANYKAAYCMAVCPAGDEIIGEYNDDKKAFKVNYLKPLRDKIEPVYVVKNSDAHQHVSKRFPHKKVRIVHNSLIPDSIATFKHSIGNVFQRGQSKGIDCLYEFNFRGSEKEKIYIEIKDKKIAIINNPSQKPKIRIFVNTKSWFSLLARETNIFMMIITGRLFILGNPKHLLKFGNCFPS